MPYCPECRYIYRPGVEVCPDCGAELVDEEEMDQNEDGVVDSMDEEPGFVASLLSEPEVDGRVRLVAVYRAADATLADLIHGVLASEGIESVIHSEEAPMLRGVFAPAASASAEILVAEPEAPHAREVIKAYLAGRTDEGVRG